VRVSVHFPRGKSRTLVQRSAPREFTQYARNPARNVIIGGNRTGLRAPLAPFSNFDEGRRYALIEDSQLRKLASWFTALITWRHIREPADLPVNKRHFDMVYSHEAQRAVDGR
jgi:trimethylamine--corrinoid protein Co-methyltransferase